MAQADFYQTLGVGRDAPPDAIKQAYRRLAMKYHPDRNAGDKDAEARFKEVQQAYAVLSDKDKRAQYDRFGHAGPFGNGGGFQGADFSDFFDDLLGRSFGDIFGSRHRTRASQRGQDTEIVLDMRLEEAANGTTREIPLSENATCNACGGSGGASVGGRPWECETCGGVGRVEMQRGSFLVRQICPACRGDGRAPGSLCAACGGNGRIAKTTKRTVKIPAGIDHGEGFCLEGKGELGPGGAGDLYIRVRILPHDLFVRNGNDLHLEMPISILTAALGGEIVVPTLSGSLEMKVPAETQSGKIFRLRGKGIKGRHSATAGDLLCRVIVETPVKLNDEQKDLLRQFGESLDRSARSHTPRSKSWFDKARAFFGE